MGNLLTSDHALIIFVKNPEAGKVKTRLAKTIGDTKALEIYNKLLDYTRSQVTNVDADRYLFYSREVLVNDSWPSHLFIKKLQKDVPDLGERMESAFWELFCEGYRKICIIGSDCPEITADIVNAAFEMLEEQEVVIGPAEDGGYYLLGMNALYPDLFKNKTWSTNTVFKHTLEDIRNLRLKTSLLPTLRDLDLESDLKAFPWLAMEADKMV